MDNTLTITATEEVNKATVLTPQAVKKCNIPVNGGPLNEEQIAYLQRIHADLWNPEKQTPPEPEKDIFLIHHQELFQQIHELIMTGTLELEPLIQKDFPGWDIPEGILDRVYTVFSNKMLNDVMEGFKKRYKSAHNEAEHGFFVTDNYEVYSAVTVLPAGTNKIHHGENSLEPQKAYEFRKEVAEKFKALMDKII